jgi:DNA-binding NtrC family response regulator
MIPPILSEDRVQSVDLEQPGTKSAHVLVVEDDASSRRALTLLLKLRGFNTSYATTLAEAMRSLAEHPLCVLLDLMLPDGNGAEVLAHIRRNHLPIRVAVTSGAANWESLLNGVRPDAYFAKPLDFEGLVRWITIDCCQTLKA